MGVKRLLVLNYEKLREDDSCAVVVSARNTNRVDRDAQLRGRAGAAQEQYIRKVFLLPQFFWGLLTLYYRRNAAFFALEKLPRI